MRKLPIQARDRIEQLEKENQNLKSKLDQMRRASAPMTRVVKAPTEITRLPSIRKPILKEKKDLHKCREPELERQVNEMKHVLQQHVEQARQRELELNRRYESLQKDKDMMEQRFVMKLDNVRGQLADKKFLASSYSHDINRLQNNLKEAHNASNNKPPPPPQVKIIREDNSEEIAKLKQIIEDLKVDVQSARNERDRVIEMGRKAELTTLEYYRKNQLLEENDKKRLVQFKDLQVFKINKKKKHNYLTPYHFILSLYRFLFL